MDTPQNRRVVARITPQGWQLELDDASWAELMTAITIAIDVCDQNEFERDRAARLRTLRTQLSHAI